MCNNCNSNCGCNSWVGLLNIFKYSWGSCCCDAYYAAQYALCSCDCDCDGCSSDYTGSCGSCGYNSRGGSRCSCGSTGLLNF